MTREELMNNSLIKEAMKSKDTQRLQVLKNLKSEVSRDEGGIKILKDSDIIGKIKKTIKTLESNLKLYQEAGNTELVNDTKAEIYILENYLPKQMSESDIKKAMVEILNDLSIDSMSPMDRDWETIF